MGEFDAFEAGCTGTKISLDPNWRADTRSTLVFCNSNGDELGVLLVLLARLRRSYVGRSLGDPFSSSERALGPIEGRATEIGPAVPGRTAVTKNCAQCGAENEDDALYCSACGKKFPEQGAPAPPEEPIAPTVTEAPVPPESQSPPVFTAEMGTGSYKHLLTDVYLKDSTGKLVLVARRQSLLNHDYTVEDGDGSTVGFFSQETHLTQRTRPVKDAGHNVVGVVQVGNLQRSRSTPNCWLEDASGNRLATLVFSAGVATFTAQGPDGSTLFEASYALGPDIGQTLKQLGHRLYTINLDDPGFSRLMVLATIAALDEF